MKETSQNIYNKYMTRILIISFKGQAIAYGKKNLDLFKCYFLYKL
jgi:hypothetical protein